jgi:predicted ATPase
VTLTGPGGSGKTRLALEAADSLLDRFASGVYLVGLAPLRDPDSVASSIAQALGLRERGGIPLRQSLQEYLREKQMLLLLDNFEQVLAAAPLVSELLAAAPRLKILVTSRAPLHLQGEKEFAVPPLALPPPGSESSVSTLARSPAVALLVQRAQDVRAEFGLTEENAAAVAAICRRLDGLPLALVLAAARLKLFSPQALLPRLVGATPGGRPEGDPRGSPLQLLTRGPCDLPARQQTLRKTIQWSYELLSEAEKRLFGRLSVFVDGCPLEAAEAVCGEEGEPENTVLDGVAALVDQSLLQQEERAGGEARFLMLETIREYGLERLIESGEASGVQQRHAEYFLALAERAEAARPTRDRAAWAERLVAERDNVRAALEWYEAQEDGTRALRLAGALWALWLGRGHLTEGCQHLTRILARGDTQEPTAARARALHLASVLLNTLGDDAQGDRMQEQCLPIWRHLGNRAGVATSLFHLAGRAYQRGELARAQSLWEESLAEAEDAADKATIAYVLVYAQSIIMEQGDPAAARSYFERGLALSQEVGVTLLAAVAHDALALLDRTQSNIESAEEHLRESLTLHQASGFLRWVPNVLISIAGLAAVQGQAGRAARLFGAADALRQAMEVHLNVREREEYERDVALARLGLGETDFAAAWAAGQAMTLEQAVRVALEEEEIPTTGRQGS